MSYLKVETFEILEDGSLNQVLKEPTTNYINVTYGINDKVFKIEIQRPDEEHIYRFYILSNPNDSICNETHRFKNMRFHVERQIGNNIISNMYNIINDSKHGEYYSYRKEPHDYEGRYFYYDYDHPLVDLWNDSGTSLSKSDDSFFNTKLLYGTDFLFVDEMIEQIKSTLNFEVLSQLSDVFKKEIYNVERK